MVGITITRVALVGITIASVSAAVTIHPATLDDLTTEEDGEVPSVSIFDDDEAEGQVLADLLWSCQCLRMAGVGHDQTVAKEQTDCDVVQYLLHIDHLVMIFLMSDLLIEHIASSLIAGAAGLGSPSGRWHSLETGRFPWR